MCVCVWGGGGGGGGGQSSNDFALLYILVYFINIKFSKHFICIYSHSHCMYNVLYTAIFYRHNVSSLSYSIYVIFIIRINHLSKIYNTSS